MPLKQISQIYIGKIDGKHEFIKDDLDPKARFFDAFLVPDNVNMSDFDRKAKYFITGFRGTGKTSLLRWYAEQLRTKGAVGDLILFKTGLTPAQKQEISNQVGAFWAEIDSRRMEVVQDFKDAWHWFFHHQIGRVIRENASLANQTDQVTKYLRLLGMLGEATYQKVLGFLPKLEGAKVKIKADLGFFEAELSGDLTKSGSHLEVRLDALNVALDQALAEIKFQRSFFLFIDELEVFFQAPEQYIRDLRMVRDILFTTNRMNEFARIKNIPAYFVAAVRSEILDAMGPTGEEIERLVYDRGVDVAWHHARRDLQHPLLEMIRRKIWVSEEVAGIEKSDDPITVYFPSWVKGQVIDRYLLDNSFYKPRDLIWRLSLAQKHFPTSASFTEEVLIKVESDYSAKLWTEIEYELGANYTSEEVKLLELTFSAAPRDFDMDEIAAVLDESRKSSPVAQKLLSRRSVEQILRDLYRLGAIGNVFRAGSSGELKHRWVFRGDTSLLAHMEMELNPALSKRLATIAPRRRGRRGGRHRYSHPARRGE